MFSNPPGDLKALFPLTYSHDEAFENLDDSDSVRTLKEEIKDKTRFLEKSDDDQRAGDYVDPWIDRNCDGWWNQRGDFITQREVDAWRDSENGNGVPDGSEVDKTPDRKSVV